MLVRIGARQPCPRLLVIVGVVQLAPVDDPDGRPRAHDPELRVRPGEHEIGPEIA